MANSHSSHRPSTWDLLIWLPTGAVVLLAILSFGRRVESFQPVGVDVQLSEDGWQIETAGPFSELTAGDLLLLINGQAVTASVDVRPLLREPGEAVVLRGGELTQVRHGLPPLRLDVSYLLLSLIGAGYLLIGLYTRLRGPAQQGWLFYLWCLATTTLYIVSPTVPPADRLDVLLYLVDQTARLLLPPLTLHFFLVFPHSFPDSRTRRRRLVPFLYLPSLALLLVQLDLILFDGRWLAGPPSAAGLMFLDRLELALLCLFALAAIVSLVWQARHASRWDERRQVLWISLGMSAGYLPFLALYTVPFSLGAPTPELLQAVVVLPLGLVPLAFAWAILRYRLWDMAVILRDSTTYTLTLLLGGLGFSLLNLIVRRGIPDDLEMMRSITTVAGGLMIAGLLIPAKNGIGTTLERFQYRSAFARRRALLGLGDELLHERDLDALCAALLGRLEETLEIERCNLFLTEGVHLEPVRPEPILLDGQPLSPQTFGEEHWGAEHLRLEDLSTQDPERRSLRELYASGYRSAFPLTVRNRRLGVLLCGSRDEHVPLSSDDLLLIRQLLNQTALAIENAQLIEGMQQKLREVSELKQFNEEIIESSPAGIAVLDHDARIVSANLAFAALVGFERGALRRRPIINVLAVPDLPDPDAGIVETPFVDSQGRHRQLQLSAAGLAGESYGWMVLVVNDVTEITEMERALAEKEKMAALGMMAAGVAHEVNTPLTGISSYAQMLLQATSEDDPRYRLLTKVERQTFRAARIVNRLLELSRSPEPEAQPVDLRALVSEAVDLLEDRLGAAEIEVVLRADDDRSYRAEANEGELHQVLTNLLVNAIEAMLEREGDRRLSIELEAGDEVVRAHIEDNGPGIAPELMPSIFQPFFSTRKESGGTGLGLSISREFARRYGGDITVCDGTDGGARFTVELPRLISARSAT